MPCWRGSPRPTRSAARLCRSANHTDAIALLKRAHGGAAAANHLRALIAIKSAAAYEPMMVSAAKAAEAIQHAERLVVAMDAMLG